jgi:hypothetical protein
MPNNIDEAVSDAYKFASDVDGVTSGRVMSVERSPTGFDVEMDIRVGVEACEFDEAIRSVRRYCREKLADVDVYIRKLTRNP